MPRPSIPYGRLAPAALGTTAGSMLVVLAGQASPLAAAAALCAVTVIGVILAVPVPGASC